MRDRRPYLVPASNYYVLAFAVAGAVFFIIWGVMHDLGSEMPWIIAGVSFSGVLFGSVIVREIFLRRAARRRFAMQMQVRTSRPLHERPTPGSRKLTLEKNEEILEQIRKKSSAANVLSSISSGHREVYELCGAYLAANEAELKMISASSPRLAPLLRSRTKVMEAHRFHMLKWAEIESKSLIVEARKSTSTAERSAAARDAMDVLDTALASYPAEQALIESKAALGQLAMQIRLSEFFEDANSAADSGDLSGARQILRDALYYLGRQQGGREVDDWAEQIRNEIVQLDIAIDGPQGQGPMPR